ncbi:MAG: DUF763 domain-containing protein [Dehalococcoidia bacterium]
MTSLPARRTGTADLPLHGGRAPRWLFQRMSRLAREIVLAVTEEYGPAEVVSRLSDPFWFHSLGCLLGFDWHSSGLTTTTCGALKDGLRGLEGELGLFICGGKGAASRRTPQEVTLAGERLGLDPTPLIYASRMSAKVDSAALQDGYQLYHHTFVFTASGSWAVVQQGMNGATRYARRYHWRGEGLASFVNEPHTGIVSPARGPALNLVAAESHPARQVIPQIAGQARPEKLVRELTRIKELSLPPHHPLTAKDIHPHRLAKIFLSTYERKPADFEALLGTPGVGPRTLRALSLLSEVVWGVAPSFRDPARYSFAHGGKDGYPYPVDRETYDETIDCLSRAVSRARLGHREKMEALRRLGTR